MQQHIQFIIQLQQTVDKPIMGMLLTSWVFFLTCAFVGRLMLPAAGGAL